MIGTALNKSEMKKVRLLYKSKQLTTSSQSSLDLMVTVYMTTIRLEWRYIVLQQNISLMNYFLVRIQLFHACSGNSQNYWPIHFRFIKSCTNHYWLSTRSGGKHLSYTRWTTHHCINSLDLYNSLTFFISDLLRAVPIIIDFLQDLEANICLTRDGRHITPWKMIEN
jgi:hypothetical protein